jgi:hypothetical protein
VAYENRYAFVFGKDLDILTNALDQWSPDKDRMKWFVEAFDVQVNFEAGELPAVPIATNGDVESAEALLIGPTVDDLTCAHNHSGTGSEHRHSCSEVLRERLEQFVRAQQVRHRCALTAGDDEGIDIVELYFGAYCRSIDAERPQPLLMNRECALKRKHADGQHCFRAFVFTSRARRSER